MRPENTWFPCPSWKFGTNFLGCSFGMVLDGCDRN
jgi:hypothetical protein